MLLPPLLTIGTVIVILIGLEGGTGSHAFDRGSQASMFFNTTGVVLVFAGILLDLRARENSSALAAWDVRFTHCVSALFSLLFLVGWITGQAGLGDGSDFGTMVMFIFLPKLLVCTPLLWYSARVLRRTSLRVGLLASFVAATVWAESQGQAQNRGDFEERLLMVNSLLVAFAVAIALCVWGATEFRSAEGGES